MGRTFYSDLRSSNHNITSYYLHDVLLEMIQNISQINMEEDLGISFSYIYIS